MDHDGVCSLAISPDRRFVFSGGGDNAIVKFDFATGVAFKKITYVHSFGVLASQVWRIAIAPNGEFVVSGDDGVLKVLSAETLKLIQNLDVGNNQYEVFSLAVAPDSTTIAAGDQDGEVQLWKKGEEGR